MYDSNNQFFITSKTASDRWIQKKTMKFWMDSIDFIEDRVSLLNITSKY